MDKLSFGLSVETEDRTGEILAVYFQIRKGRVAKTKEIVEGTVFADFDKEGKLLGIEMLGPCEVAVLDKISNSSRVKRFVKESIPRGMLATA